MGKFQSASLERLFQAVLCLDTPEECSAFLEDLCTIKELQDISQRLDVAFLLQDGKNYQEISAKTGVSTATISRVNRSLLYGSGGYQSVIKKLKAVEAQE